jgi:broad specificity phosphatase PhoE
MTTRLLLIRHGATTLTAEDRFAGSTEVELSDEGRRQAQRLSERLSHQKIAAFYASPMKRTMDTAGLIAAPHGLPINPRPGLKEIDHGRWEQNTRKEVEQKFAEEYATWEQDPFTFAPKGGESGLSVLARALPCIREIVTAHPNATVAVVSHKATLRLLLCSILGIDARGYRDALDQSPCALNVLDFKDVVRARLVLFNDVSHYEGVPQRTVPRLSPWWDIDAR